jgi:hypothetical protein
MGAGLAGGVSLGQNAPLKEGPKDHSYEIVDGEAKARVYDTPVSDANNMCFKSSASMYDISE